jgi:hypothetical protein
VHNARAASLVQRIALLF